MWGSKGDDNELAINNDEKETSKNISGSKNGSLKNLNSHLHENDKILKEKETELDLFVHQYSCGGQSDI